MKIWKFTSLAVLAFAGATQPMMAAADEAPACPVLSVTGSQSGANGAIFTANVSGTGADITYRWSISAGSISEGQGTPTIAIGDVGDVSTYRYVTATVEIGGFPDECNRTGSETVEVAPQ